MKNLPLNEKHLADKLQNVPLPDVEQGWEQMRRLLDRDMPEGAGAWSGNRKWWWMGITAVIVMVAAWLAPFGGRVNEGAANAVVENTVKATESKKVVAKVEKVAHRDKSAVVKTTETNVTTEPLNDVSKPVIIAQSKKVTPRRVNNKQTVANNPIISNHSSTQQFSETLANTTEEIESSSINTTLAGFH